MEGQAVEVVLIEDDPNDAELILRVLRKNHLANSIVHLKDGAEALQYLFAHGALNPKMILLDLKLPKVNGIEVLQRLKSEEATRDVPVVVLTSSRENGDLQHAYDLGVNSYVAKPIHFDEFAAAVAELGLYWMMLNRPPK